MMKVPTFSKTRRCKGSNQLMPPIGGPFPRSGICPVCGHWVLILNGLAEDHDTQGWIIAESGNFQHKEA